MDFTQHLNHFKVSRGAPAALAGFFHELLRFKRAIRQVHRSCFIVLLSAAWLRACNFSAPLSCSMVELEDPVVEVDEDDEDNDEESVASREGLEWQCVLIKELRKGQQPKVECLFCEKPFTGGATRIRAHILGGQKRGGVSKCLQVQKKNPEVYEAVLALQNSKKMEKDEKLKKRKLFDLSKSIAASANLKAKDKVLQSTLPKSFQKQEVGSIDGAWATCFFANGLSFRLADDPYFLDVVAKTAAFGLQYKPPSAFRMAHCLLESSVTALASDLQVTSYFSE